jgi:hypothetical protein
VCLHRVSVVSLRLHVCMHERVLCWSKWLTKADTVEIVGGYLRHRDGVCTQRHLVYKVWTMLSSSGRAVVEKM